MAFFVRLVGIGAFISTVIYLIAYSRFFRIVDEEMPAWVQKRGSLSSFYDGLPRQGDPNVTVAVIRTAFDRARVAQLKDPHATLYARLIRWLLVGTFLLDVFLFYAIVHNGK